MNGSCHCGQVTVELPGAPDYLNQCNCTVCTKLGSLWGYYDPDAVRIAGSPRIYRRADTETPSLNFEFCATCGSTIRWSSIDGSLDRTGINMLLVEPAELDGVEVRYGDRRNWESGPRHHYREPSRFRATGARA